MKNETKMDSPNADIHHNGIYKAAISHIPELAYIVDKHCSFVHCNLNFLNFIHLTAIEDTTPGALYKIMLQSGNWTEKQVQELKAKDIETILAGTLAEESKLQVVDQQEVIHHYSVSRIPLLDDNQSTMALLVIFKDITEMRYMQEQYEGIKVQIQHLNGQAGQVIHSGTTQDMLDHPLNVLVIEDNIIAQKAAQGILMQIDCTVDVAKSEAQMLEIFKPGKYDMIFMDIGLEETSGYMLAKQIRAQEKDTDYRVPIIALTGYKADMLTTDCAYYQMEGAITKPLTLEQARQLIQRYIHNIDIPVTGLKLAASP